MVLSKKQEDAIEWIKRMQYHFSHRWFIFYELSKIEISWIDFQELVTKGYLEKQEFEGMAYYRFRGGI